MSTTANVFLQIGLALLNLAIAAVHLVGDGGSVSVGTFAMWASGWCSAIAVAIWMDR